MTMNSKIMADGLEELFFKPAFGGLPSSFSFNAQLTGFFTTPANFRGNGFLCCYIFRNGNHKVDDIVVGEARVRIACHHVPCLRER